VSEKPASNRRRARETVSGGLGTGRPLSLMRVPVPFEDQHRQQPPLQQASWWMLCTRWLTGPALSPTLGGVINHARTSRVPPFTHVLVLALTSVPVQVSLPQP